jgi:hypothetical protein
MSIGHSSEWFWIRWCPPLSQHETPENAHPTIIKQGGFNEMIRRVGVDFRGWRRNDFTTDGQPKRNWPNVEPHQLFDALEQRLIRSRNGG